MYDSNNPLFQEWIGNVRKRVNEERPQSKISYSEGKRYIKIIDESFGQRSAFGFVDKSTGAIFKTASWNAPAKHPRGFLNDKFKGMNAVGRYGMRYLR